MITSMARTPRIESCGAGGLLAAGVTEASHSPCIVATVTCANRSRRQYRQVITGPVIDASSPAGASEAEVTLFSSIALRSSTVENNADKFVSKAQGEQYS